MSRKAARVLAATLILLAAAVGSAHAARYTQRFEQTYAARPGVEVRLTNTNGSVSVEVWDRDTVEVVAEKAVDSRTRADAEELFEQIQIVVRAEGDRVEIETRQPSRSEGFFDWLFGRGRNVSVRYEIKVPLSAALDLRTVNGSVSTDGAGGEQNLRSTNGRITVGGAHQAVVAHTTNGSIQVEVIEAPQRLDIDLGSTNGSITLAVPDGVGARIAARTVNGSVRSDLPVTIAGGASRKRINGDLNSGGPGRIEIRTTNGSIRIEHATV